MPNHITHRLTITGNDEEVKKVFNFIKIEKPEVEDDAYGYGTIDFNKIVPMPEHIYTGNLGDEEIEKYGKENCWYYWCNKNWGTKWNAYSQLSNRNTENTIYFNTAWSAVPELIEKLSNIFPNVKIEYAYCDEDFGYNTGIYTFENSKSTSYLPTGGSKEAFEQKNRYAVPFYNFAEGEI